MGEDAAEHGFDVLQRGLRQIAVVRNSAKHFARVHGSESAQADLADAFDSKGSRYPGNPCTCSREAPSRPTQVELFGELRQRHAWWGLVELHSPSA